LTLVLQFHAFQLKGNNSKVEATNAMKIYGVGGEKHRVIGNVTLPLKFKALFINIHRICHFHFRITSL
jgi:hypothetical protein